MANLNMKMNPVVHFELPAEDTKRMVGFYAEAFGWQANQLGPEMGEYVVVMTTESDKNGPKNPGAINGGFFKKTKDTTQYPSVVIAVDDILEATKKVEEAGGKVLGGAYNASLQERSDVVASDYKPGEPDDIPGVGLYSSFIDTEGNRVGMLQPLERMEVK